MKGKSFYESETESVHDRLRSIIRSGLDKDCKVVCKVLNKIFIRQLQSCLARSSDFSEVWDELKIDYQATVYKDPYGCRHYDRQEATRRDFEFFTSTSAGPACQFAAILNRGASKAFAKGHTAVVRYVPVVSTFNIILVHNALVAVFVDDGSGGYKQTGYITVPDLAKIAEVVFPSVVDHIGYPEQLAMDVDVVAKLLKQYTVISDTVNYLYQVLEDPSIQNQCLSALEKRDTIDTSKEYTDWEDAWATDGNYYVALFHKACAKLELTCEVEDSMDFYSAKSNEYYGSLDWELVCEFMDTLVEELKSKKIKVPGFIESVIGLIQSESYYDEDRFGSEDDWEDDEESED